MNDRKIHSVRYNFVMNFLLTASQFLFPLITFPYVSRVLQASGNGKIAFVASFVNYFVMVASLGIPTYGVRACAQVRDNKDELSKTVHEIFTINLVMMVFVAITYVIAIFCAPRFQDERLLFLINGINILLNPFGMNWLYQALEQYDYITFRSIVFKIISVILMFIMVHKQQDYIIYGAITVFAAVGSNVLNFIRSRKYITFCRYNHYNYRKHIKPILVLFAQSLAVSIYTNLDTVMLGFIRSDVDVGYYNAAVKLKTILLSLVTSLGNVLLPRMSYYAKEGFRDKFKQTMQKALNFTVLLSVPLVIYFCIYANEAIDFLAGNGYMGAVLAMQIITIAVIPIGITGVLGVQVLTALEKEECVLASVIVGAIVDFILNMTLIPNGGAAGAALATTIAELMVLFVQCYYTRDYLKEMSKNFRIHIYLVISVIAGILSSGVKLLPFKSNFVILVISAFLFFGVYGIGLLITREDVAIELIELLKKKIWRK